MRARLRLVAQPDAALSIAARRATVAGARDDTAAAAADRGAASGALADLDAEHAARCPSPVLRDIARRLGSQLLRSAATAWPSETIDHYRADSQTHPAAGRARRRRRGAGLERSRGRDGRALRRRGDGRVRRAQAPRPRPRPDRALARRPRPRDRGDGARGRMPTTAPSGNNLRPPRCRLELAASPPRRPGRSASLSAETRALRIGVGGPVGSGKSSLIAALCRELAGRHPPRRRDERHLHDRGRQFLRATGVLAADRIVAVQTGCCPHTAIRDDITINLEAVEELERDQGPLRARPRRERAATTSRRSSARRSPTCRSSSSTSRAATTSRARAGRGSRAPTCSSSTRPTSRRTSAPTWSACKATRAHAAATCRSHALSLVNPPHAAPVADWIREQLAAFAAAHGHLHSSAIGAPDPHHDHPHTHAHH